MLLTVETRVDVRHRGRNINLITRHESEYCVRSPMGGDSYASPSVSPQPPADDDGVKVEVLQT